MEVAFKRDRDRQEYQGLIQSQLAQRQALEQRLEKFQREHQAGLEQLYTDLARTQQMARGAEQEEDRTRHRRQRTRNVQQHGNNGRSRSRERTLEP